MDDDQEDRLSRTEMVQQLVLEAGCLLESLSVPLALQLPAEGKRRHHELSTFAQTARNVCSLLHAACALDASIEPTAGAAD